MLLRFTYYFVILIRQAAENSPGISNVFRGRTARALIFGELSFILQ